MAGEDSGQKVVALSNRRTWVRFQNLALFQRNKNEKKATTNCSGPALDGFAIRDHDLPADTMGHEHKGSQASITLQCRGP